MDPMTIVAILEALAKVASDAYSALEQSGVVLTETDAKAVHVALLNAQNATNALRPKVDAALEAAAAG